MFAPDASANIFQSTHPVRGATIPSDVRAHCML